MRIAVLVGAGASLGAFDTPDLHPPLGDQLFSKLADRFPMTWGSLPSEVVEVFGMEGTGFELGMAALREEGQHTQRALIDMGIFFASFRLRAGMNRYITMLKFLDWMGTDAEYAIASLNYETLLEQSLLRIGHSVNYAASPPSSVVLSNAVHVIKPHGSCNFAVDTGTNSFIDTQISGAGIFVAGAPLKVVDLDGVSATARSGFPPAMSLYAPGKPDIVCPEAVAQLRSDWANEVGRADLVVTVGARPMVETDPHIWQPVIDSEAKIGLIGSNEQPLAALVGDRLVVLGRTFADGLQPLRTMLQQVG